MKNFNTKYVFHFFSVHMSMCCCVVCSVCLVLQKQNTLYLLWQSIKLLWSISITGISFQDIKKKVSLGRWITNFLFLFLVFCLQIVYELQHKLVRLIFFTYAQNYNIFMVDMQNEYTWMEEKQVNWKLSCSFLTFSICFISTRH